jgi:hypothetical protein
MRLAAEVPVARADRISDDLDQAAARDRGRLEGPAGEAEEGALAMGSLRVSIELDRVIPPSEIRSECDGPVGARSHSDACARLAVDDRHEKDGVGTLRPEFHRNGGAADRRHESGSLPREDDRPRIARVDASDPADSGNRPTSDAAGVRPAGAEAAPHRANGAQKPRDDANRRVASSANERDASHAGPNGHATAPRRLRPASSARRCGAGCPSLSR